MTAFKGCGASELVIAPIRLRASSICNRREISPASSKEQEAAERKFCEERGIRYYRIPMKQGTPPSPEQAARMLSLMDDSANHPVFMHDSQGIIREGMMVALFQMERMGYSPERALKEARWFGHDESPVMVKFINSYRLTK